MRSHPPATAWFRRTAGHRGVIIDADYIIEIHFQIVHLRTLGEGAGTPAPAQPGVVHVLRSTQLPE